MLLGWSRRSLSLPQGSLPGKHTSDADFDRYSWQQCARDQQFICSQRRWFTKAIAPAGPRPAALVEQDKIQKFLADKITK